MLPEVKHLLDLGLSIAKELVSRMDGEIEAKIEKKEFIVKMNFPIVTDAK